MAAARRPFPTRGLYALTPDAPADFAEVLGRVARVLAGGGGAVQYRDKQSEPGERRRRALALRHLCREHDVPFLVNDDVALAAAIDADGAHIGRDDATVADARRLLGPRRIVGVSCYGSLARARAAVAGGADYVAFGSFFPSRTKPGAEPCTPDLLPEAAALGVPVVAIGGITPENAGPLLARGAGVLAVITALFEVPDSGAAARAFVRAIALHSPNVDDP
jgi:thiamine-phosphate pyrophosphorylase